MDTAVFSRRDLLVRHISSGPRVAPVSGCDWGSARTRAGVPIVGRATCTPAIVLAVTRRADFIGTSAHPRVKKTDPAAATHFWNLVRELPAHGATVMLATHSFSEAAAVGDSVAVLYRGRIVACGPISDNAEELRSFYFEATGEMDETRELASRSWR